MWRQLLSWSEVRRRLQFSVLVDDHWRMTLVDFLATPDGGLLLHALIGLIVALTAYVSYLTRRQTKENHVALRDHMAEHAMTETNVRVDTPKREA